MVVEICIIWQQAMEESDTIHTSPSPKVYSICWVGKISARSIFWDIHSCKQNLLVQRTNPRKLSSSAIGLKSCFGKLNWLVRDRCNIVFLGCITYQLNKIHKSVNKDVGKDGDSLKWIFNWRRPLILWEEGLVHDILILIDNKKPSISRMDRLVWTLDKTKWYSFKSLYTIATQSSYERTLQPPIINFIWQRKAPHKAEYTLWFLVYNKLKTLLEPYWNAWYPTKPMSFL